MKMQQIEMLKKRFEQADEMIGKITEAAKKDISANGGASKMQPEEYKFQLQAIIARALPINEVLALSAELLYRQVGTELEGDEEANV